MTLPRAVVARAHAKLNLSLRVLGPRPDGYHELRTVFQSIGLHDTLTCLAQQGPFRLLCRRGGVPLDDGNLIWQAAERLWRHLGKPGEPADVSVFLEKEIPVGAGLGGGSSDAAAALLALSELWTAGLASGELAALAAELGADVPFFFHGGTMLGLGRGDQLRPLPDRPACWVVLLVPPFGVSTREAYGWHTADGGSLGGAAHEASPAAEDAMNDLEAAVWRRHPEILEAKTALERAGASRAAMSGSGSAVFGLFETRRRALAAARRLERPDSSRTPGKPGKLRWQAIVSPTIARTAYQESAAPRLLAANPSIE